MVGNCQLGIWVLPAGNFGTFRTRNVPCTFLARWRSGARDHGQPPSRHPRARCFTYGFIVFKTLLFCVLAFSVFDVFGVNESVWEW